LISKWKSKEYELFFIVAKENPVERVGFVAPVLKHFHLDHLKGSLGQIKAVVLTGFRLLAWPARTGARPSPAPLLF
jgi:hypothetical protein